MSIQAHSDPRVALIDRLIANVRVTLPRASAETLAFAAEILRDLEERRAQFTQQPELDLSHGKAQVAA